MGVYGFPQGANALAVNNAHLMDSARPALGKVGGQ